MATRRSIPGNLTRMLSHEAQVLNQSVRTIETDDQLSDHVELLETVMGTLNHFGRREALDIDQETIQLLGARAFNDLACGYSQLTRGYYQLAAATLRDVMEILFLYGYFARDSTKIRVWRESDDSQRRAIFSPMKVRAFLDNFDGFKEGRRGQAYKMFCEYAAHATWHGFILMRPSKGGRVIMGAFFDAGLLRVLLEETAQLAGQIGNYYSDFFDTTRDLDDLDIVLRRLEVTSAWAERYLGLQADPDRFAELRRMRSRLREDGAGP